MTEPDQPVRGVRAVRVELHAPVASFRDPMFPGVTRCLPVPPPSTVRGMLAAATGEAQEAVRLGMAARSEASGVDTETYHPVAADGSNPAIGGRVAAVKGGMTIRDRPFLVRVHATIWIPEPDGARLAEALRRPVWPLRLGRSQDLVYVLAVEEVSLEPAREAWVGHALAPIGAHSADSAAELRVATRISSDRLSTAYGTYLWCPDAGERQQVRGAYHDRGEAVWLLDV